MPNERIWVELGIFGEFERFRANDLPLKKRKRDRTWKTVPVYNMPEMTAGFIYHASPTCQIVIREVDINPRIGKVAYV